jgi:hypothetical protein
MLKILNGSILLYAGFFSDSERIPISEDAGRRWYNTTVPDTFDWSRRRFDAIFRFLKTSNTKHTLAFTQPKRKGKDQGPERVAATEDYLLSASTAALLSADMSSSERAAMLQSNSIPFIPFGSRFAIKEQCLLPPNCPACHIEDNVWCVANQEILKMMPASCDSNVNLARVELSADDLPRFVLVPICPIRKDETLIFAPIQDCKRFDPMPAVMFLRMAYQKACQNPKPEIRPTSVTDYLISFLELVKNGNEQQQVATFDNLFGHDPDVQQWDTDCKVRLGSILVDTVKVASSQLPAVSSKITCAHVYHIYGDLPNGLYT